MALLAAGGRLHTHTCRAWVEGTAHLVVDAKGEPSTIVHTLEPYDDTEDIALALLMLRSAA